MKIAPQYELSVTKKDCLAYFSAVLDDPTWSNKMSFVKTKLQIYFTSEDYRNGRLTVLDKAAVTRDECLTYLSDLIYKSPHQNTVIGWAWHQLLEHFPIDNLRDKRLADLVAAC